MASKIEWLAVPGYRPETWNPYIGCTPVSRGCERCWAQREENGRFRHLGRCLRSDAAPTYPGQHYFWRGPVLQGEQELRRPLHWREPRCIFVCPRSDLFHEQIAFEQIDRIYAVMALCPRHLFIVLTKRPARMREYFTATRDEGSSKGYVAILYGRPGRAFPDSNLPFNKRSPIPWPLPNVWLGTSVEDQPTADERIPELLKCPAAVHFVSVEPMLGAVQLGRMHLSGDEEYWDFLSGLRGPTCQHRAIEPVRTAKLDWVICGGESGPGARPMHNGWPRQLRDDCKAAGVAYFFKQWGEWGPGVDGKLGPWKQVRRLGPGGEDLTDLPGLWSDMDAFMERGGKNLAGRLLDGVTHGEFPRIRAAIDLPGADGIGPLGREVKDDQDHRE